jgi:glycosyltransferase involved in cell wall biosynthesis
VRRRCKDGSLAASGVLALESALHTATRAYSRVGVFACPSRFMAAKMAQAGVFPERMRCVPHFVDASAIAPADRPGQGAVFAGRLSAEKGVDTLIEAVARLGSGRLEIAGDGPERAALTALAKERAPGRVRFHGHLPKTDLYELLRSSAVAVLPSRCYENQPLIVLEAFACGVPVLCSDLGGMSTGSWRPRTTRTRSRAG